MSNCLGSHIFEKKCIEDEIEAYRSAYDGSEDLSAQKEMANWAKWLLMLTAFTSWVSLLAVVYVARTFGATNDTLDEARNANQIMRDEQRPWVTIIRDVECEMHDLGHSLNLSWNYNLANKGKTPAYDVHVDWVPVKRNHYQKLDIECAEYAAECIVKRRRGNTPIIFPSETNDFLKYRWSGVSRYDYIQGESQFSDKQVIFVFVCVSYRLSNTSDKFGAEVIAISFQENDRWLRPFSTKMLEYASARYIQ